MTIQEWIALTFTSLSIVALVARMVKWYIDTQVKPIKEAVEDIRKETKTNGGSSMRDEIRTIKQQQDEAKQLRKATSDKLDHMYDILIDYISRSK